MKIRALALALVVPAALAGEARAADDACFTAAVEGQKLERAGKLLDARQRFVACGQRSCDQAVIEKCEGWLGGVEKKIPSVSLALRDPEGRDVAATRATIDGVEVGGALGGRAVDVDPGSHRFAAWAGAREFAETVIVREGEKGRVVLLQVPGEGIVAGPRKKEASPAMLYGAIGFGGLAVASGAVFAVFSAKGVSDRSTFGCDAGCSSDHFQTVHHEFLAADVALGVAIGSLAVATTLFLLRPKSPSNQAHFNAPTAPLRFRF